MKSFWLPVVSVLSTGVLAPQAVQAAVSACGNYAISSQNQIRNADTGEVFTVDRTGVAVTCSGTVITCEGDLDHLVGTRASNTFGIFIPNVQNVTVQNCRISGFDVGIKLGQDGATSGQGGDHKIHHNVLKNNRKDGLDCDGVNHVDYWDNEARDNGENGFELDGCHDNNDWNAAAIFENCRAIGNGKHGFTFDGSSNQRLHAIRASGNGFADKGRSDCTMPDGTKGWESTCESLTSGLSCIAGQGLRIDVLSCTQSNGTVVLGQPSLSVESDWSNYCDNRDNGVSARGSQYVDLGNNQCNPAVR